jgi:tetratricopeptide (TPR) repeat protein
MIKKIFLYTFLLFGLTHLYGQKKSAFLQAADEAFANKNYYGALKFYNEALEFDEKDADVLYKSAESARLFNSYKIAAEKYSYLIDTLQIVNDSSTLYYAGEMYQRMGQYDKATEYYDLYLTQYNKDGDYLTT